MGNKIQGSPLRIMAGEKEKSDMIGVIIYRERLPKDISSSDIRKRLLVEIENVVKRTEYPSYWVSPKAGSWLQ